MNVVVLFYRSPIPGRTKTRLASSIGSVAAATVYRGLLCDIYVKLQDPRFRVAPYRADRTNGGPHRPHTAAPWEHAAADHPYPARRSPAQRSSLPSDNESTTAFRSVWAEPRRQRGADLGERMADAMTGEFLRGAERVLLVGSDIPGITAAGMISAFDALASCDAVLGPTTDGGYYLIGFRRFTFDADVFADMHWSTPTVYRTTRRRLSQRGLRVHAAPPLQDLDTLQDLANLFDENDPDYRTNLRRAIVSHSSAIGNYQVPEPFPEH